MTDPTARADTRLWGLTKIDDRRLSLWCDRLGDDGFPTHTRIRREIRPGDRLLPALRAIMAQVVQ